MLEISIQVKLIFLNIDTCRVDKVIDQVQKTMKEMTELKKQITGYDVYL